MASSTPAGGAMTLVGVYAGNSVAAVEDFEEWLGQEVGAILTHLDMRNWGAFEGSAAGFSRDLWSKIDRPVIWSIPLIMQGTTLEQAATGAFNVHFAKVADWINRYSTGDEIYIRPGWEFNGNWMPWSAKGHEQAYIDTFRQFVDTFRSVSDRFVFEWNVNNGDYGMNPATAYPGDGYVDIIGMDFYHDPAWPKDPLPAWSNMVNRPYGLKWLEDFADLHGKPTAYSEWGVSTNNMAPYIEQARAWFDSHDVVYQAYWDSNAGGYSGKLSNGTNPLTGYAFKNAFGSPAQAGLPGWSEETGAVVWAGAQGEDGPQALTGDDVLQGSDALDGLLGNAAPQPQTQGMTGQGATTVATTAALFPIADITT
jgi:hypothetical protein